MIWSCPCGCGLQLDAGQVAKERRLAAIAGNIPPSTPVSLHAAPPRPEKLAPEDVLERTECDWCGTGIELQAYLVAFLRGHGIEPACRGCARRAA